MISLTSDEFARKKKKLFEKIKSADKLNEDLEGEIVDVYGSRGKKAIEVVKESRVKKDGDRWLVKGSEDEYEVVRSHCFCYDYVLNIVTGKADVDMCYHALAKNIRELLDSDQP